MTETCTNASRPGHFAFGVYRVLAVLRTLMPELVPSADRWCHTVDAMRFEVHMEKSAVVSAYQVELTMLKFSCRTDASAVIWFIAYVQDLT